LNSFKALPNKGGGTENDEDAPRAYAGHFTAGNGQPFQANWWKHERAKAEWVRGGYYTLELDVPSTANSRYADPTFDEPFYIIDCWPEPG
jgi:hypothetical protein